MLKHGHPPKSCCTGGVISTVLFCPSQCRTRSKLMDTRRSLLMLGIGSYTPSCSITGPARSWRFCKQNDADSVTAMPVWRKHSLIWHHAYKVSSLSINQLKGHFGWVKIEATDDAYLRHWSPHPFHMNPDFVLWPDFDPKHDISFQMFISWRALEHCLACRLTPWFLSWWH